MGIGCHKPSVHTVTMITTASQCSFNGVDVDLTSPMRVYKDDLATVTGALLHLEAGGGIEFGSGSAFMTPTVNG